MRDKAFNIAKNLKYNGYQRSLASVVYKFLDIKTSATHANKFTGCTVKNKIMQNKELPEELHKLISRNLKTKKYTHLL